MKSIENEAIMRGAFAAELTPQGQAPENTWMQEERLPFTVRVVRDEEALHKAVYIRQAAYARHVPAFAEKLKVPEPFDRADGSVILLAESKLDGSPLGTMRIQTNDYNDLTLSQSVELPAWLRNQSMAEATRLGVEIGRTGRLVKTVLFKAYYLYCVQADIDWMVITARPPVDRQYEALLFQDLFPGRLMPMRHVNDIPHRVLAFEVGTAEERWAEANHPLTRFMVETRHPDIDLSPAEYSSWSLRAPAAELPSRAVVYA
jgi:hypothetical protein